MLVNSAMDITKLTPQQLANLVNKKKPKMLWRETFHKAVVDAVIRNDGNRNAAARELEVARSTVYHHWKAHIATNPNPFEGQERKYSFRHIDGRHRRPIS